MAQIAHLVRIRATPEQVYRSVASTGGIAEWFTQASSPDYRQGGTLELRFSGKPVSFTITELTERPTDSRPGDPGGGDTGDGSAPSLPSSSQES